MAKHLRRRRGWRKRRTTFPGDAWQGGDGAGRDNGFFDYGLSEAGPFPTESFDEDSFGREVVDAESFPAHGAPDAEPVPAEPAPDAETAQGEDVSPEEDQAPDDHWFGPSQPDVASYAARRDVSLASMLMLGTSNYQRIDGMGLARKALEAPPSGDPRLDISDEERSMLANARAWCLLVHGDLGHLSRLDDPFVLADAERFVEVARGITPGSPYVETTLALLRLRQGRTAEALESAQRAIDTFARIPEHQRGGRTQGAAILAVVTHALVAASSGDLHGARVLGGAARAVVTPLDLDEAAFEALMAEVDRTIAHCT